MMHLHAAGLFHINTIDITLDKALTLTGTLVIDATGIVGQFLQMQAHIVEIDLVHLILGITAHKTAIFAGGHNVVESDTDILILDTSAACHMPDVLEMPYRPPLKDSGNPSEKKYNYRLGSQTCLSGDFIGEYSFDNQVNIGDRLVFEDMAIYSMVKNNTFNGMPLPTIYLLKSNGDINIIKKFGYENFRTRL